MSRSVVPVLAEKLPGVVVSTAHGPRLLRDYLAGETAAGAFYGGHPGDPAAYVRKAAEVDARLDPASRSRLAAGIRPLSPSAGSKLAQVMAGRGYFVTTGQQAGLFTGPLYTILKALSAIRLAGALEALLARPVLALFWSAADDHDWDEVAHATVLDENGYPARIELAGRSPEAPHPMSRRVLDGSASLALDRLRGLLPATVFRDGYLPQLRTAYASGRTMAAAFEDTLAAVLAGQEIALVSSADPVVKQHSASVVRDALEHAERDEQQVARQTERLVRAGYHAQVSVAARASNVFFSDEEGRDRLVRQGDGWITRRTRRHFSTAELRTRLDDEPAAFSPNVLLRPVVESALFPTLAYVGGPAETSYFAQIGCLFRAHGIMPPVVFPRHSVTLVEGATSRALDRFGMELAQLSQPLEELLDGVIRRELPPQVTEELERLRGAADRGLDALGEATAALAPGARASIAGTRRQVLAQLTAVEKKIVQHARREQAVRLEQLRRAAIQVYPGGQPQERVLNAFHFLARYGPELLARIAAALPHPIGTAHTAFAGVECGEPPLAAPSWRGIA
jgi:bacillithiol biosynthesis cysteine-adding enzyme BshC